ncbi:hypothetical protein SPSYN_03032 [Sporotomaculum syntrophicum]|uniref:Uncharacterized protein n=1 Tax=Sporotomaculum syntrophicum TaxID=182264 RepID=A0A9D3AX10_9FIRM|nr:hypothetical protein [Sporotomaculum syntrophicum]KAF1083876.1 hypothetical protein SPSYN_03032 [Sporotomaculum syntrophicum]
MQLFFHTRGKKRVEYQWQDDKWTAISFGSYAKDFLNACLDLGNADEYNTAIALGIAEEMAGVKGDEAITNIYWPVLLLAVELVSVKEFESESFYRIGKDSFPTASLLPYITGQDIALWNEWTATFPEPYMVTPGNKVGLLCTCGTIARAAIAELVVAFTLNKKTVLHFCKKCGRFYCGENCERCLPEALLKKRFLGLLRIHKSRYKTTDPEFTQEIGNLQIKLVEGQRALSTAIKEYKETCREFGITTRWVKNYSVIFKSNKNRGGK